MGPGIIILEGPDGAGKSYLADYFRQEHKAKYIHCTYRWTNRMFDYHTAAISLAGKLARDHLVVVDRWWPSEIAYGKAFRGGTPTPLAWRFLQRVLLKYAGMYVLCLPEDTRRLLDDFVALKKVRDENYMASKEMHQVVIEYHKLFEMMWPWPNFRRYDRYKDGDDLGKLAKQIGKQLEDLRADQPENLRDPRNRNVLGHLGLAKYLFVGEQTNPRKKAGTWWPFYDYAASSLYLTEVLDKLNFQEHEAMWCNAIGEPEMARYLLDRFDLKPICLGTEAYLHVTEKKAINYSKRNYPVCAYHPAYDKRFPVGHKGDELFRQIGSVLIGSPHSSIIYRDNTCVQCGVSIIQEDRDVSIARKAGIRIG